MIKNNKILWGLIAIMILAQIYVPASMIWSNEEVLTEGKRMEFRVAPIDPNDPFRGKYITLEFEHNVVPNNNGEEWLGGELAYAILGQDSLGYYMPIELVKSPPQGEDYIELTVQYSSDVETWVEYPFDKFYMEESKAPIAEDIYFDMMMDREQHVYAVVYVKEGKAILEDVEINGVSIVELVNESLIE